ncbi:MAG TPA: tripartite tricarboxylate transporter substrate binding protein [Burkholderiales bacterium]|jgi:tripartite-type tricarboxylate transporter receptor subunit TctC|nr:tripartite tricarboxylate transporter substrate binding protein [Burkholderiales bacterium]
MTSPVLRTFIAAALLGAAALPAHAQSYPTKPVRFIVPFPPGGPVDATARAITFKLSEYWKQQAIVDNRAGAGGIVGAEVAAKSPADGYTVFVCSIHHSVLPSLRSDLSYNIEKDFAPVTFATAFPIILVAHPSVQSKSVKELVAYARANPGKLSYGSAGNGGGTHLAGELFKDIAKVDLLHVPYKGSAPAMTDLLGGQVQLMFSDGPTALPQIKGGKVRALAVGSPKRSALVPDLPTIAESGLAGYDAYSWSGIVVPAATPKEIVAKLNADIVKALNDPEVKKRLLENGAEAMPGTPDQFAKTLRSEITKWGKVVKAANIKAD